MKATVAAVSLISIVAFALAAPTAIEENLLGLRFQPFGEPRGKLCLDNRNGYVDNGNPIQLWNCDDGINRSQLWTFRGSQILLASTQFSDNGPFCLERQDNSSEVEQAVVLNQCNNVDTQKWQIVAKGHKSSPQLFTVVNEGSRVYCLDVFQSQYAPGTKVIAFPCTNQYIQVWYMTAPAPAESP
ncbi:hypothetical protein BGZ72_002189 [Mortierella alpina]|nr:hypothetical protein BGZ72_002189 [Mortierella alpina]